MSWQDILTIIVPVMTFLGWIYSRLDKRFDESKSEMKDIKSEMKDIKNELNVLNTRVAVVESRLNDISTNVTHLMWHHQTLPQKEIREE